MNSLIAVYSLINDNLFVLIKGVTKIQESSSLLVLAHEITVDGREITLFKHVLTRASLFGITSSSTLTSLKYKICYQTFSHIV